MEEIGRHFRTDTFDRQRRKQLRAIFSKYRDLTANRRELAGEMKRKFGIELVFFGKTDSPYGYMIIDHNSKSVMNGGKIYSIRELLDFSTADERFSQSRNSMIYFQDSSKPMSRVDACTGAEISGSSAPICGRH